MTVQRKQRNRDTEQKEKGENEEKGFMKKVANKRQMNGRKGKAVQARKDIRRRELKEPSVEQGKI